MAILTTGMLGEYDGSRDSAGNRSESIQLFRCVIEPASRRHSSWLQPGKRLMYVEQKSNLCEREMGGVKMVRGCATEKGSTGYPFMKYKGISASTQPLRHPAKRVPRQQPSTDALTRETSQDPTALLMQNWCGRCPLHRKQDATVATSWYPPRRGAEQKQAPKLMCHIDSHKERTTSLRLSLPDPPKILPLRPRLAKVQTQPRKRPRRTCATRCAAD